MLVSTLAALLISCCAFQAAPVAPCEPVPAVTITPLATGTTPAEGSPAAAPRTFALDTLGKTFIVVLWATWCPASRQSLERLCQVQETLGSHAVGVVGITDETQAVLSEFTQRPEWKRRLNFAVAADESGSTHRAFLGEYRKLDIPAAFVVQAGKVQWVGHPMDAGTPAEAVANGTWNCAAARTAWDAARNAERERTARQAAIAAAAAAKDWTTALELLDRAVQDAPPAMRAPVLLNRAQVLLMADRADEAYELIDKTVKESSIETTGLAAARTILRTPGVAQRRVDVAMKYLEALMQDRMRESAESLNEFAYAQTLKGDFNGAAETLARALEVARAARTPDTAFVSDLTIALREANRKATPAAPTTPAPPTPPATSDQPAAPAR